MNDRPSSRVAAVRHRFGPFARAFAVFALTCLLHTLCSAQPKSELTPPPAFSPAEGERAARELIGKLLAQRPAENSTNTGRLRIRDTAGNWREVPAKFEIVARPSDWLNVYEAAPVGSAPGQKLTIIHADGKPNEYFLSQFSASEPPTGQPRQLTAAALMVPFAGSDFWTADLGLEFLHWPGQRVLRQQMRKGLMCDVLQSTNPAPAPGAYSRVDSWIAVNRPDDVVIVHAEAFDSQGRILKEFDPKKVEKVNGVWQLSEMEIRNVQTGTRTKIDFDVGEK